MHLNWKPRPESPKGQALDNRAVPYTLSYLKPLIYCCWSGASVDRRICSVDQSWSSAHPRWQLQRAPRSTTKHLWLITQSSPRHTLYWSMIPRLQIQRSTLLFHSGAFGWPITVHSMKNLRLTEGFFSDNSRELIFFFLDWIGRPKFMLSWPNET